MATYFARKAGNINATDVWATTQDGVAGDYFPSFTSNDTLMLNNFAVTLNVDVTVLAIRSDTANGATSGGTLPHSTSRTINANIVVGSTPTMMSTSTAGISLVVNGNITSLAGAISYTGSSQSITVYGNIITNSTSNTIFMSGTDATIIVNGNLINNAGGDCIYAAGNNFSCTVNGNITLNGSGEGINHQNASATSCSIVVTGTITSGSSGFGIYCAGGGTGLLTIVCGSISVNSVGYGVVVSSRRVSSITVNGNILLNTTSTSYGVSIGGTTATGTLYIDGDIIVNGNGGDGVLLASTSPAYMTTTITGNVIANNSVNSHGLVVSDASIVTIQGNVSSSSTGGHGVLINGNVAANVTIEGTCTGGLSAGAYNNSAGSVLTVEGMVYGGPLSSSEPGVKANGTGAIVYISFAEYGTLGATPTAGPIRFVPSSSNTIKIYTPTGSPTTKTLVDTVVIISADPSDVRYGVTYDNGTQTGTLVVPINSTVLNGVTYDNGTVGTLIMTASDFWNTATSGLVTSGSIGLYLKTAAQEATVSGIPQDTWDIQSSGLSVSGSIGERLKNAATIGTVGQQLSDALNGL